MFKFFFTGLFFASRDSTSQPEVGQNTSDSFACKRLAALMCGLSSVLERFHFRAGARLLLNLARQAFPSSRCETVSVMGNHARAVREFPLHVYNQAIVESPILQSSTVFHACTADSSISLRLIGLDKGAIEQVYVCHGPDAEPSSPIF